jgi:hypothetical protein
MLCDSAAHVQWAACDVYAVLGRLLRLLLVTGASGLQDSLAITLRCVCLYAACLTGLLWEAGRDTHWFCPCAQCVMRVYCSSVYCYIDMSSSVCSCLLC